MRFNILDFRIVWRYFYLRQMKWKVIFTLAIGMMHHMAFSQINLKDSVVFTPLVNFSYAYKVPGGDLAVSFGAHSEVGIGLSFKNRKNWLFGGEFSFLFGNKVKDQSFADSFRDKNGFILGNNGLYSEIYFSERGWTATARIGKLFPVLSPNLNSGIVFMVGVGMLEHRIKMEDRFQEVPLLSGDNYSAGYDRLTNGLLLTQFVGYRLLSNRRLVNIFGGFEFSQGFTQNRRAYNYDTGLKDSKKRFDFAVGLKIGISIPLYKQQPNEYYYY